MISPRLGRLLGALALAAAGIAVAWGPLSSAISVDIDGDWRSVCVGCRRSRGPERALALPRAALVHFHGLQGRAGDVGLWLSARSGPTEVVVAAAPDGPPLVEARLSRVAQRISLPVASGTTDVDLWLRTQAGDDGLPALLHRVSLERRASGIDVALRWVPCLGALAAFLLLGRQGPLLRSLLLSLVVLMVLTLAVMAIHDPATLLELRPGPRRRMQVLGIAVLAGAALYKVPGRPLALAALAAASALLHLPTVGYGLVSDDFLWARPWTLAQVASTYVGPEDPLRISNDYYRPLPSSAHALDHLVWGDHVQGYHVTNLLLHALVLGAGLALLERMGLSRRAALVGALAWGMHPMAASAVAWVSQRTDLLVALFYLSTLAVLISPLGRRTWPVLVVAALALMSKELAITLPATAAAAVFLVLPPEERRGRYAALRGLVLLGIAYVVWWTCRFPDKVVGHVFPDAATPGRDQPAVLQGLRNIVASIVWPVGYEAWWNGRLQGWSPFAFVAVAAAFPLIAVWLGRGAAGGSRAPRAAATLGVLWPLVVALPLFGIENVDPYRLGLLASFAFALVAAALAHHLEHGRRALPVIALALVLVAWLAPLSIDAAQQWGPGGFYYEMAHHQARHAQDWIAHFSPAARARFWRQVEESDHRSSVEQQLSAASRE